MNYLAWALFVEGSTDVRYFSALIPRLLLDLVQNVEGPLAMVPDNPVGVFGTTQRGFETAAAEICRARDAFHLLFVHGDTGSRGQEQNLAARTCALCDRVYDECGFPRNRCVIIAPRRETEAWCLADQVAIRTAFGVGDNLNLSFIPTNAAGLEGIADPKAIMRQVQSGIRGGARRQLPPVPYAGLAQKQDLARLRQLPSFRDFEVSLIQALNTLGYPHLT